MKEKLNKKSLVIKNLKEAETILKESFTTKIKEKEEQIEKLMNIISVLPDVYQEKIEETRKIPRSFHNEKNLEKEKKILKEMYNNINNLEIQKNVQKKIVKNSNFKQKKLSW